MKFSLVSCLGFALAGTAGATQFQLAKGRTPMSQVVQLLSGMKARIEGDGMAEQQSYDKYACWCEDTLARKARDISSSKAKIEDLQALIIKVKSEIAAHGAEIKQLEKDIQQNLDSQGEARAVRDSEFEDYNGEKTENEQCIGALEAAVKALAGAGTGKFLETSSVKQAELLSVVAGVRAAMNRPAAARGMSSKDLELVHLFVDSPADFAPSRRVGQFAQVSNNPFGDYAPQSTQIQGILKGLYDTFVSDMEKANVKEAESQKAFEALMATKLRELQTLKDTLRQQQVDHAQKIQTQAESKELLDATKAQLEADENFFDQTKAACQVKSQEWNERSRLRTMELAGVNKAIEILSSPEAQKTFGKATSTFVQLSSVTTHRSALAAAARRKAFKRLAIISRKFRSLGLAEIAAKIKAGGHFDKVIASIDRMTEVLRAEEQEDIEHRDRCESAEGKNSNEIEDLNHAIGKAQQSIEHLDREEGRLNGEIDVLETDLNMTNADMDQLLRMRNAEVAEFRQAMQDDTAAVALVEQAMVSLRRFFEKNNIKLSLLSKKGEPEYSVDQDKAPETSWDGGAYGGRKEESGGIVAIMEMLIEDLQHEMKTARADDAEAQNLYEKQRGAMQDTLDKQLATTLATEREKSDVQSMKAGTEEHRDQKNGDLEAEDGLKIALYSDCSWVKTHFASRRQKRKSEMDGLVEAKGYLAGVAAEGTGL